MFRKVFTVLLVLSVVMICPLTSLAMSATPYNASRASTSNAFPMDDFVDSDMFDSIEFDHSSLLSSSDDDSWIPVTVINSVSHTDLSLNLKYYTMSGVVKYMTVPFDSNFYASLPLPSDCATIGSFFLRIGHSSLPSPGRYSLRVLFSSNTGVEYWRVTGWNEKKLTNASTQSGNFEFSNFLQQSGDWYAQTVIELGSVSFLDVSVIPKSNSTINLPYGGYVKVQFVKTSAAADTTTADGGYTSDNAASDTAQNTSKIVEQGDTIIETIKNVIQTISSQLTAFWNQLAGEFTNLYNKMNQQHTEQLEADRENTEEVTTAIENHGNFIIEGLKRLFIPSDEYFKAYFDDLYNWFSDRFGFLSFPIDLLVRVVNLYANATEVDCILTLPGFSIMDHQVWADQTFNLTDFLEADFAFLLVAIKMVTSIMLIMAFVHLCETKWNEVMAN